MAEFMADDPDWLRSIARSYPSGPQRARLVAIADAAAAVLAEAAPASCTAAVVLAGHDVNDLIGVPVGEDDPMCPECGDWLDPAPGGWTCESCSLYIEADEP